MLVHVHVCIHACVGWRETMGIFLHHTYLLRQQALTEPGTHRVGYIGCPVRSRSLLVVTPSARGCGHALLHPSFCVRAGDLSLGPPAYTVSTLLSEPLPQPHEGKISQSDLNMSL